MSKKIITADSLQERVGEFGKIVFIWGGFDQLDEIHHKFLGSLKNKGDTLIVGVASDLIVRTSNPSAKTMKPMEERLKSVSQVPYVDYVVQLAGRPQLQSVVGVVSEAGGIVKILSHDQKETLASIETNPVPEQV